MHRRSQCQEIQDIEFSIDEEFKTLLPPLPSEDFEKLEKSILDDGCRDPLVVWKEEKLLIDGQNRHVICTKHNLPYRITEKSFASREHVKVSIRHHKVAREGLAQVPQPVVQSP